MFKYLLGLLLSVSLFAQNTNPTCVIVGLQHQGPTIGGNLSIPLYRLGIATSGVHMDVTVQNNTIKNYVVDNQEPVYESYSAGYYVDYGRIFVSLGYSYLKETTYQPWIRQGYTATFTEYNKVENTTNGAYLKLGLHAKYVGVYAGYSTNAKASYGILFFIPFN